MRMNVMVSIPRRKKRKGCDAMSVYEMAKAYYPRLWDKSRLEALVAAGRLTQEQTEEIINEKEGNT